MVIILVIYILVFPTVEIEEVRKAEPENGYQYGNIEKYMDPIKPPSEWTRFTVLLQRSFLQLYRDWVGCKRKSDF